MKKKMKSQLRKLALRYLGLDRVEGVAKRVINPDVYPSLDYRFVFGSVAMVRNPSDLDSDGKPRWLGPVEIQGASNDTHTYFTAFGDFCYARILTEKEKDRHAKYWKHALTLVEEG